MLSLWRTQHEQYGWLYQEHLLTKKRRIVSHNKKHCPMTEVHTWWIMKAKPVVNEDGLWIDMVNMYGTSQSAIAARIGEPPPQSKGNKDALYYLF